MRGVCTLNFEAMQLLNSENIGQVGLQPVASTSPRVHREPGLRAPGPEDSLRESLECAQTDFPLREGQELRASQDLRASQELRGSAESAAAEEPAAKPAEKPAGPRVVDASKLVAFSAAPPVPCMTVIRPRRQ